MCSGHVMILFHPYMLDCKAGTLKLYQIYSDNYLCCSVLHISNFPPVISTDVWNFGYE
jgi:hypothetical protein